MRRAFHDDLQVPAQSGEALQQPSLGNASELSAEQSGNLGLGQTEELRSLDLRQSLLANNLRDFCNQLRLDQHFRAVREAQVRVHIPRSLFHRYSPVSADA